MDIKSILKKYGGGLMGGAALLCIFGLATKGLGMVFRLYLSNRIGSEGMGLYQLVLSVYSLFTTFATAGLTVSVSRLTGEALGKNDPDRGEIACRKAKNTGVAFSLILGFASLAVMFASSGIIAKYMLSDVRSTLPMKILSLSMPFMSTAACYKGYYIASHKVMITASAQLLEQLVKIAVTYVFFTVFLSQTTDVGSLTTGITIGLSAGEAFSCVYFVAFDVFSKKRRVISGGEKHRYPLKTITGVVLPIAAGAYVTGILHTAESVLIPFCFTLYGGDRASGLADFGLIRGMVIPALFFPFAFLSALISVLIPEISRLSGSENKALRDEKIKKVLAFSFICGIAVGGFFFFLPRETGMIFYNSPEAGRPLRILAAVTPFMYVETVCDSILKSIGEQVYTLRVGLINSVSRIVLLLLVIPSVGAEGYLWLLVASNLLSFVACYLKLRTRICSGVGFVSHFILPSAAAFFGGTVASAFSTRFGDGILTFFCSALIYIMVFFSVYLPFSKYGSGKNL